MKTLSKTLHHYTKALTSNRRVQLITFIIAFAVIGVIALLLSSAASPNVPLEAESGTITSPATKVADTTASGGNYLLFGSGTVGSCKPATSPAAICHDEPWKPSNPGMSGADVSKLTSVKTGVQDIGPSQSGTAANPTIIQNVDYQNACMSIDASHIHFVNVRISNGNISTCGGGYMITMCTYNCAAQDGGPIDIVFDHLTIVGVHSSDGYKAVHDHVYCGSGVNGGHQYYIRYGNISGCSSCFRSDANADVYRTWCHNWDTINSALPGQEAYCQARGYTGDPVNCYEAHPAGVVWKGDSSLVTKSAQQGGGMHIVESVLDGNFQGSPGFECWENNGPPTCSLIRSWWTINGGYIIWQNAHTDNGRTVPCPNFVSDGNRFGVTGAQIALDEPSCVQWGNGSINNNVWDTTGKIGTYNAVADTPTPPGAVGY